MKNLAELYDYAVGVPVNYPLALTWYRKSAALDDDDAMYHLGRFYEYGYGVTKDEAQALTWYRARSGSGQRGGDVLYRFLQPLRKIDTARLRGGDGVVPQGRRGRRFWRNVRCRKAVL